MPITNFQVVASANRPVGTDFMDSSSPYYLVSVLQDIKASVRAQALQGPWFSLLGLTGSWVGALAWTFTGGTTASIQGDQSPSGTGYLKVGDRVRAFVTAGTAVGTITAISVGAGPVTNVTFVWDGGGALDSGLTDIQVGGDPVAIPAKVVAQDQVPTFAIITNSGGGAWVGATFPVMDRYQFGQTYTVQFQGNTVGSDTLNLNGLGVKNINKLVNGSLIPLVAGDIPGGATVNLTYDGIAFQFQAGTTGHGLQVLSGSGNFIAPAATLVVDLYGGSGGGAGGNAVTGGGGGGGGAHFRYVLTGLTPGVTSIAYAIGAAGAAGPGNGAGGNGGNTTFGSAAAAGGSGAPSGTGGAGGAVIGPDPALTWLANDGGVNGQNGTNPSGGFGGTGFIPGGNGGGIGTGNAGNPGHVGSITVTW